MGMREYAEEVLRVMTPIYAEMVHRQPKALMKGKISLPQMVILEILLSRTECKMSEISRMLGVTKGAVTGITDRLLKLDMLRRRRSRDDRRVVTVRLTRRGKTLARNLHIFKVNLIARLFSRISRRERRLYLDILKKLEKNLKLKNA